MYGLVAQAASIAAPSVAAATAACHHVRVLPLHHNVVSARAAYLRYADAKADFVKAVVLDGHSAYVERPDLTTLRDAALEALVSGATTDNGRLEATRAFSSG